MKSIDWQAIEDALATCRRTHRGDPYKPCYLSEHMWARRQYHALMVDAGMLDQRLADR